MTVILDKQSPRSVRADNQIVEKPLLKLECLTCGLVRDGNEHKAESLLRLYKDDYVLNASEREYHFLTRNGPIARSKLFYDWICYHLEHQLRDHIRKVLEIGCGAGHLLQRMQVCLPQARCLGTEFNIKAADIAVHKGCAVIVGGVEQVQDVSFDLTLAIGVLEHVPQPSIFLDAVRKRMSSNGLLVLAQPTQDVPSSDIFFTDHLHHFGTDHLSMYARRIGFTETVRTVGHPLMPNFSLRVWEKAEPSSEPISHGRTCCRESVAQHEADYAQVNDLVREIESNPARRLAVFGLNERYALLSAYSRLGDTRIACGLSDIEPSVAVDFPVVKPESVTDFQVTDVLLCVNKVHLGFVRERLASFNVTIHVI